MYRVSCSSLAVAIAAFTAVLTAEHTLLICRLEVASSGKVAVMKRTMYLVLVVVLIVGVVCTLAWAAKGGKGPKGSSGVTVVTVDASAKGKPVPMPGVTVELFIANGPFVTSSVTDANAEVEFASLLPSTTYVLIGKAPDGRMTGSGFTTNTGGSAKTTQLAFYEPAP